MQLLANGLINGLGIGVMGLAFAVVYVPTRVFHVALGGIYGVVPFLAWASLQRGWHWSLAILAALVASVVISLGCELLNHGRLERRGAAGSAHLVSSLGIYIVLAQAAALVWGNEPKMLRAGIDGVSRVGGVILTSSQLLSVTTSIVLLATFFGWLKLSDLGLQYRAMADNPVELALRGFNLFRLRLLAFSIAGALAAAVSLASAFDRGFEPHAGLHVLLLAVVAAVIGGQRTFLGPVVAGVILGLIRSGVAWFASARWQEAATFLLLAGFLLFRPQGLLSRRQGLEAEQ